jgi:hypothetical protein
MADYTRELKKLLSEAGCSFHRQGKEIMKFGTAKHYFPVDSKIKSRHTANGILKQAGLAKRF